MRIDLPIPQDKPFDVVGVGINVIDYLFRIPHFPEPNTKMDALGATLQGGGLTATAMVACARLGLRTRYIGKFGDNEIGRMARQELLAEGLDLAGSVVAEGVPNCFCVVLVEEGSGHRTIVRQRDPRIWLTPAELTREAVCAGRVLHLDGHEGDAALQAARWAKQAGVLVSMDAEEPTQHREELFPLTDVLIVSQRFARALTGKTAPADILHVLATFGPACVGLTLGGGGIGAAAPGRARGRPWFSGKGGGHHGRRRRVSRRISVRALAGVGGRRYTALCECGLGAEVHAPRRPCWYPHAGGGSGIPQRGPGESRRSSGKEHER